MNLPAQAFQYASFVDSNGRTNTNSHDALAVFRCVNDECHGTLTKHQPYTGSDLLGGVMAQEPLAAANVSMLRRVIYRKARREGPANVQSQSSRAFSFFKRRLASAAQHASIQASDRALHHVADGAWFWMGSAWKRSGTTFHLRGAVR